MVEAAHATKESTAKSPVVGHDVKVSNLWTLRGLGEWLCSGYTNEKARGRALNNAAFTSYAGGRHLCDLTMELAVGRTA